eukprot:Em0021g31a
MLIATAQDRTIQLLIAAICAMTLQQCCVAYFITTPTSTTVCAGTTATFYCGSQTGTVVFLVNGSLNFGNKGINATITQGGDQFSGVLKAPGTWENDNLTIACIEYTQSGVPTRSNASVLRIQGPPPSVSNITFDAASATLSWTPPSNALNISLLSYQVIVSSKTTGQTLINNITMETRLSLPLPKSCGSLYFIEVHSMCETLIGASAQLTYDQNLSISNLIALPGNVNSIMLSWKPLISPPLNYTILVTRDDGYTEGIFVTKATALTVPLSQQLCGLYHISVATMCVTNTSISSGPKSSISIALGTPPPVRDLQCNVGSMSLHVMWEVPLNSSHLTYYVEVTEQKGTTVYSNVTTETALVIALVTAVSQQYRLTVTPMCGAVMGTSVYLDVLPTQTKLPTPEKADGASQQIIKIAVGTGMGAVFIVLLVALVLAVIVYKRCKGGQSGSGSEQPIRILWSIHRLFVPNKNQGPHDNVLYQDVIRTDPRTCEEQGKLKKTLAERQQLSQGNLYTKTERKNLQGHDTVDGITLSSSSIQEENPYMDVSDIRCTPVIVPLEPHYSTPRVHYGIPRNDKTSIL